MVIEETYRGIVHGSIIQLNQSIDIPDGMEVDVVIKRPVLDASERTKKLLSLFGACKDDVAELDQYMAWNDQQRKQDRPGIQ
jgi:predicted RNA-binding protein with RPS1 domain